MGCDLIGVEKKPRNGGALREREGSGVESLSAYLLTDG
jgi:hypothetical protein